PDRARSRSSSREARAGTPSSPFLAAGGCNRRALIRCRGGVGNVGKFPHIAPGGGALRRRPPLRVVRCLTGAGTRTIAAGDTRRAGKAAVRGSSTGGDRHLSRGEGDDRARPGHI